MTAIFWLLIAWTICSFLLGVFVGRFIRFGMESDEASTRVLSFMDRRQQLSATLTRRRL